MRLAECFSDVQRVFLVSGYQNVLRSAYTHIQPRIGLSKLSYTAATLSKRVLVQIIILLNTELLIVVSFKRACVYLIISIKHNIV